MDFVTSVSAILPLAVIAELMGLPQEDRNQFFRWTNEIVGANDPEFAREDGMKGRELAQQAMARGISIAPGPIFSANRKYQNFVRLSCACRWDETAMKALSTLAVLVTLKDVNNI